MADHTHHAGDWMLSYRYRFMDMKTNRLGDTEIADSRIIAPDPLGGEGFLVTPQEMQMHMHMAGVMYAPTDRVTFVLMAPYVSKSMDHTRRDGFGFTTESEGFGDLQFAPLIKLFDGGGQAAHAGLGIEFPSGSVDEEDGVPRPGTTRSAPSHLPYPMQIGSGTYDLLPRLTYVGQTRSLSWGAQVGGTIRLGENANGYRLGDQIDSTAWGAVQLTDWLSISARLACANTGNIDGADRALDTPASVVPTADPNLRGGQRLDLSFGANLYVPGGRLKGHRIAAEIGFPLWEDLEGPQLGQELVLTVSWQYAF